MRINGRVYHNYGPLRRDENSTAPVMGIQSYIYDSAEARSKRHANLDPDILCALETMLRNVSPFIPIFERAEKENPNAEYVIKIEDLASDDSRRYNAPVAPEISIVLPGDGNDGPNETK
eukprot:Awhi_evm2s6195